MATFSTKTKEPTTEMSQSQVSETTPTADEVTDSIAPMAGLERSRELPGTPPTPVIECREVDIYYEDCVIGLARSWSRLRPAADLRRQSAPSSSWRSRARLQS